MTRDEVQALLPFLANGTLEGAEREEAEQMLDADPDLRAELHALQTVRATLRAEDPGHSPGEIGLARLMREVGKDGTARRPFWQSVHTWQSVAAALLVALLLQALFTGTDPGEDGYELAGADPEAGPAITVAIRPDTTEAAFRDLLLRAGAEIVGGPSALGLYELRPLNDVTIEEARRILETSDIVEDVTGSGD